jgi:ABC-type multidrug transport system fused ATPase/permease subunit
MNNWTLIKHLLNFSKPFRKYLFIVFACILSMTVIDAVNTILLSRIFDIIQLHSTDINYLDDSLLLVGIATFFVIFRILVSRYQNIIEIKHLDVAISNHLNHNSISKYFNFSNGQHINEHSGVKQSIITSGFNSIQNQIHTFIYTTIPAFSQIVIAMTILFTIHWAIGLAYFVFGLLFSLSLYFFNKYLSPKIKVVTDYRNQTAKTISELYRLVFLIKNEVGETKSLKDLDNVQNLHQKSYTDAWVTGNNWMTLIRISSTVFRYLSILTGVILLFTGYIGAGAIFLIFNWSANFINSVWVMTDIQKQFITDKINIEKYFELLNVQPDVIEVENPIRENFIGDIEFKNVFFKYPKRDQSAEIIGERDWIINNLSFKIESGSKVAFVGESGSGKSTIANLVRRAFDPQQGEIKMNSHDLREIELKGLLRKIGSVDQDVQLFDRSIKQNIQFGSEKELSADDLNRIAKLSRLDKFYHKLESGWDTTVGERGLKISGGEKQRIGIARALAKNPDILIFDEATSALDTISEKAVQKAIDEVSRGKTSIIIAHRLSTVKNCDKIFVLKDGELVGEGSHDELLVNCEYYKRLVKEQLTKKEV